MSSEPAATVPSELVAVTIVSGFLGSGKTTLLNALLHGDHGRRIAVIVNEFGKVGIDGAVTAGGEQFVELDNGCLCCAVNEDLENTLRDLRARGGFEHLVIETTGVADPLPVGWTFGRSGLSDFYRVDAILTVVDCENIDHILTVDEATEQIARADILVFNKIDRVGDGGAGAEQKVRALNELAPAFKTEHGRVEWSLVLTSDAPSRIAELAEEAHDRHHHGSFETWAFETDQTVSETALEDFLYDLPDSVYRFKALVRTDAPEWEWTLVNAVAGRFDVRPCEPKRPPPESRFVFIGQGLDEEQLRRSCEALLES